MWHSMLLLVCLALLKCCATLPATVSGRSIIVKGQPIHIKGVNWNPVRIGHRHPQGLQFREHVETDAKLMADAGINVVRTYESINDTAVLDVLWASGIQVLNTIYASYDVPLDFVARQVDLVKDHPAILMWVVGNEWNYNRCYSAVDLASCSSRLEAAAALIKQHDTLHPVASVYGALPSVDVISQMRNIDVWGTNFYNGDSFHDLFHQWEQLTTVPLFIGEYGADAYNGILSQSDEEAQAVATKHLTQELFDNSVVRGGVCSGGLIFELADEWWKDAAGSLDVQDVGGLAPGEGPFPDKIFNEEWWGLTDIQRVPRRAYHQYAAMAAPKAAGDIEPAGTGTP